MTITTNSSSPKILLDGIDYGIYKLIIITDNSCGDVATAEFLIHIKPVPNLAGVYGMYGLVSSGSTNNRPTFTQTSSLSTGDLDVRWPGMATCSADAGISGFDYRVSAGNGGYIMMTKLSNVSPTRTYKAILTKID